MNHLSASSAQPTKREQLEPLNRAVALLVEMNFNFDGQVGFIEIFKSLKFQFEMNFTEIKLLKK